MSDFYRRESEPKFKPDPDNPTRCQCVRDHGTLIDGDWAQCGSQKEINGLCQGCWDYHGKAMEAASASSAV